MGDGGGGGGRWFDADGGLTLGGTEERWVKRGGVTGGVEKNRGASLRCQTQNTHTYIYMHVHLSIYIYVVLTFFIYILG